jgi:uncharacterized protein YodC (DUF2158 family)
MEVQMSEQKHKFKAGDIVQLRSGGPTMTVDSEGKSEVICHWFAVAELRSGKFSPASLVMTEPEKEPNLATPLDSMAMT